MKVGLFWFVSFIQHSYSLDIIKLAKSIEEIADLMQELSTLVDVQGTILDRIEYNCETTLQNVKKGTANLKTANEGASKSSMKGFDDISLSLSLSSP